MAKESRSITIYFDYDPEENDGQQVSNFLYHFLNSIDREIDALTITGLIYKDVYKEISSSEDLKDLALRYDGVDSINEEEKPVQGINEATDLNAQ